MVIERNPIKCEGCCKCIEAEDMYPHNHGLQGDWWPDENGKITKWICEKCSEDE